MHYRHLHYIPVLWLILIGCLSFQGCQQEAMESPLPEPAEIHEALARSNISLIKLEEESIDGLVERLGYTMHKTGSGLRYKILEPGEGPRVGYGQRVSILYTMYLITGDPVYSSDESGPLSFTVGRGGVEGGLEEGVRLLNKGARALMIMPSHLAHGVPGDGLHIPKRATIIYALELTEIL